MMIRVTPREISSPAPAGAISPRVSAMTGGDLILMWLEPGPAKLAALRYSVLRDGGWSAPVTIADQPFSRHPSESPGMVALSEANLIAYWSQKPPDVKTSTDEVDLYFAVSTDRGQSWSRPILANEPGTGAENSYPSAAAIDENKAAMVWLDGKNWAKDRRYALLSKTLQTNGSASDATVIDTDTCTCCPTSMARSGRDLLTAYRSHTPENIRDISVAENKSGHWSAPHVPHADGWHFPGCPVNGPDLDAKESTVALAWFSAPQDHPEVKVAFSGDGGAHFREPVRIDEGNAVGRAQIVLLQNHSALAFWLEHKPDGTHLLVRHVRPDGNMETPTDLAQGAGLGYPHAVRVADKVYVTWAEDSPKSHIRLAALTVNEQEVPQR
jgi:BNR repeat-like domain